MSLADIRVRVALALVALCLVATGALALVGWPGRTFTDSDYMQYYAGSHALLEGASPYDHAWWTAFHRQVGSLATAGKLHTGDPSLDWTTPYPLTTFVALLPFALLPLSIAAPFFAATQVTLIFGAAIALAAMMLRRREIPMVVALVAATQPLWVLLAGGNATGFAAASFTFALAAVLSRRALLAGLLLAGVVIKPHLFAVGVVALIAGAPVQLRARLLVGAALGTLALLVPAFVLQPWWVGDWLREAGRLQASSFSNATGWTIARPFTADFLAPSALVVLAGVAGFAVWWWRAHPDLPRLVAGGLPVSVLVAPHGWSYDYIALLPTLVVGVALAYTSRTRALALLALALLAVVVPWALYVVATNRNGEDLSAGFLLVTEAAIIGAVHRAPDAHRDGGDRRQARAGRRQSRVVDAKAG